MTKVTDYNTYPILNLVLMVLFACIPWVFVAQTGVMFNVNDDVANIVLLRQVFGTGSADTSIFISSILTNCLIFLYRANSDIPWYSLLVYACLFVSQILLFRLIITAKIAPVLRLCLLAVTTLIVLRLALFCSFTASAMMLSNAALLYGLFMHGSKQIIVKITVALLLTVGFLLRPGLFPVTLLAFIPAAIAAVLSKSCSLRSVIQYCLLITAVVGTLHVADLFLESDKKVTFKQANTLRASFSDYAWASNNSELETASFAAGWNSADYYVARYLWWYLDDDVHSAESFKKFAQLNKDKSTFPWSSERLTATFRALKHLTTLFIILMAAWLIAEKGYRNRWLWIVILLTIISIVMLAGIRLPPRAAYPFVLMLMLAPLAGTSKAKANRSGSGFWGGATLLVILVPLAWIAWTDVQLHRSLLNENDIFSDSVESGLQELSRDIPDSIFVPLLLRGYSETSFIRPFQWIEPRPTIPSGWIAQSPVRDPYLESIGFELDRPFIPQLLTRKNVVFYFMSTKADKNTFVLDPFFYYLNSHYGDGVGAARLTPRILKVQWAGPYFWWFFQVDRTETKRLNQ